MNFLRSPDFGELLKSIVTKVINKEMKTTHDRINQFKFKIENLMKLTPTTIKKNLKMLTITIIVNQIQRKLPIQNPRNSILMR